MLQGSLKNKTLAKCNAIDYFYVESKEIYDRYTYFYQIKVSGSLQHKQNVVLCNIRNVTTILWLFLKVTDALFNGCRYEV